MRTVKGEVISTKTISLKEAAGTLSRFAASETGARPEVAACLKRSVTAFKDLINAHREIRLMKKEMDASSIKVEALEERRELVSESLNVGGKKRRDFEALEGEVEGERKKIKKKEKEKKKSFFEGGMEESSKKVEALGCEKKVEERSDLVLESLDIERKKRRHFDAKEGEVKKGEGKMKKGRRVIEVKVEVFDYEKKSEERRDFVSESLNIERKKRRDSDAQEGEVNGEMKKHEGKKKKRRRVIE